MTASSVIPKRWLTPLAVVALVLTAAARAASPPAESEPAGAMWRLTEQQYRNAIADIFGEDIEVTGQIRRVAMSQADIQTYERMARGVAAQVVDERHRGALVGCTPRDATLPDDMCAATFFRDTGRLVFRRPLRSSDVHKQVMAAREATKVTRDFYSGLGASLAAMLASPTFIFDIDVLEPERAKSTTQRLDAYSKASRLSMFLWNTTPDAVLLDAASRGELHTAAGLAKQLDRLLDSRRVDGALKTFLSEASGGPDGCEKNPVSFEYAMRLNSAVASCLTRKVYEYGVRRPVRNGEADWLKELSARFARSDYQVRTLLREIATSQSFFRVSSPQ